MRQTKIELICDVCLVDGKEAPGETHTVAIDGKPPVAMELCERHRMKVFGQLLAAIEELHPRKVAGRRRTSRGVGRASHSPAVSPGGTSKAVA